MAYTGVRVSGIHVICNTHTHTHITTRTRSKIMDVGLVLSWIQDELDQAERGLCSEQEAFEAIITLVEANR